MCGFICVIKRPGTNPHFIPPDTLFHRGPDYTREIFHKSISLRHWRLAIVDLNTRSNQPFENAKYALAYNGEIYRYKSIGIDGFDQQFFSDTHLIFESVTSNSTYNFKRSSGYYSYLLLNKQDDTVTGSRDYLGQKPLYYYVDDQIAIFSSEEAGIVKLLNDQQDAISHISILNYLLYKNFFNGDTSFSNIKEIPPGSSFSFDPNNWELNISKSWQSYYNDELMTQVSGKPDYNIYNTATLDTLSDAICSAIDARFNCDVPVQIALSGGIDSSLILAYASSISNLRSQISRTVTLGFSFSKDEIYKANAFSSECGIPHSSIVIDHEDFLEYFKKTVFANFAPLEHPHSISYNYLSKETRKHGKLLITGEGADELFFGYSHYSSSPHGSFAFRPYIEISDYFITGKLFDSGFTAESTKLRSRALADRYTSRDLELKTHLLSLLRRNDKMSMHNSIEIRSPFLDLNLFDITRSLLSNHQASLGSKSLLLRLLKNLNPRYNVDSHKNGFYTPFDLWYTESSKHPDVVNYVKTALTYLEDMHSLYLAVDVNEHPRLAWPLLNIGIFLSSYSHSKS